MNWSDLAQISIMKITFLSFFIFLCSFKSFSSNVWPNHDISSLKLVQIVHRHGERTPEVFTPNDPFKNGSYWREGIGQLTTKGKYRLYKTGQFIRKQYQRYLGDEYSPREVYARSSLYNRCEESVSCLLSGAYPPKQKSWQWNNGVDALLGKFWQPFPIETFMPYEDDLVLEEEKSCPIVDREREQIYNRPKLRKFFDENKDFYNYLSKVSGLKIVKISKDIYNLTMFFETLRIEVNENYYWTQVWTKDQEIKIVRQLSEANLLFYRYNWDTPIIHRLRAGGLVKELIKNINVVLNKQNDKKIFVYSTHDYNIALLMQSLNIFNNFPPPYGATLLLELHDKRERPMDKPNYFLRAFYYNTTIVNRDIPHPLKWGNCGKRYDCPIDKFFESTKNLIYEDFDNECKLNTI